MINGAHFLIYSPDADADRAFIRDVLGFRSVDAGGGWLIFALPPAELAVHPAEEDFVQTHADHDLLGAVLYLMCDDLRALLASLKEKGVEHSDIGTADWGSFTSIKLPSGGQLGLYEPTHVTAISQ
jgi:hypothetical protein